MKRWIILFLILILLFPIISSASIDSEVKKITYYAREYETGNINYVQLLIYTSAIREKLNEELGAKGKEYGGILKQQQIQAALGEPNERTKWVWVEGMEQDTKLDDYVPVWKKIVFDGKKIQIRLSAYPSIFVKTQFEKEFKNEEEKQAYKEQQLQELKQKEFTKDDIIYRLHFETEFKKPQNQLDISGKINEIKSLAETFNSDASKSNAEALAKASVNTERLFESYFRQTQGKCEDLMSSIFGSENKRGTQELIAYEFDFFDTDNFQAILRLEMCDECEWNWINLNMWFEGRGPGFKPIEPQNSNLESLRETYKNLETSGFEAETNELLSDIIGDLEQGDYNFAMTSSQKLNILTQAWNEKANDVWKELDEIYRAEEQSMTEEQRQKLNENYGWIKREQEKRQKEKDLRKINYETRKQFYLDLFSGYDSEEFYYTQTEFEKRLVEEFKEKGQEICDNNQDDNENGEIDCADSQCGGKFCGRTIVTTGDGNSTAQEEKDLYCISGTCQAKEEIMEVKPIVCGNHICEENETLSCPEDCVLCQEYEAINCSGKVIFSGQDETGCPLPPVCIEETKFCEIVEDCIKPLCGEVDCIENKCELIGLKECQKPDCEEGQEKIKKCDSGEQIIADICVDGKWIGTSAVCEIEKPPEEETICEQHCGTLPVPTCLGAELEISGTYPECSCKWTCEESGVANECVYKTDCGGENDVCSNGKCVTIPEIIPIAPMEPIGIPVEPEETEVEEEEEQPEEGQLSEPGGQESSQEEPEAPPEESNEPEPEPETPPATGEVVLGFFKKIINNIIGAITGFQVEESGDAGEGNGQGNGDSGVDNGGEKPPSEEPPSEEPPEEPPKEGPPEGGYEEDHWEEREDNEKERHQQEEKQRCKDECERICYDNEVRPCVEQCIWELCGNELECNVDEESKKCEESCKQEKDIMGCITDCTPKCIGGGDNWWKEFEQHPEDEFKEEKGVFQAGGGCRTSEGQTQGYLWFGGWGDPFEKIEPLKQKYYSGGQADWCKYDLENLIKQRQEFEKGFNQEFVQWFFEKYLANSAEDWEQHVSGIYELYWNNVDTLMQMSQRMTCLEMDEIPMNYNLINVEYETEYGSLEYWEELKTVRMPGPEGDVQIQMITPYMKVWIFPPREFIEYELKKAMENNEFPGSPEEKMERGNEEGLTEQEKGMIKQNSGFMNKIKDISEKYNGNLNAVIQFKDYATAEIVFNLYIQINEEDIILIKPMLPDEVPEQDVLIELDFEKLYDMIYTQEKEMQGEQIESPPWDKQKGKGGIKQIKNGIKMYFKVRDMANSAKISPEESEKDVKNLFKLFLKMMMKGERGGTEEEISEEESEKIEEISGLGNSATGKVIWVEQ